MNFSCLLPWNLSSIGPPYGTSNCNKHTLHSNTWLDSNFSFGWTEPLNCVSGLFLLSCVYSLLHGALVVQTGQTTRWFHWNLFKSEQLPRTSELPNLCHCTFISPSLSILQRPSLFLAFSLCYFLLVISCQLSSMWRQSCLATSDAGYTPIFGEPQALSSDWDNRQIVLFFSQIPQIWITTSMTFWSNNSFERRRHCHPDAEPRSPGDLLPAAFLYLDSLLIRRRWKQEQPVPSLRTR